jgi:hypothetical protein
MTKFEDLGEELEWQHDRTNRLSGTNSTDIDTEVVA